MGEKDEDGNNLVRVVRVIPVRVKNRRFLFVIVVPIMIFVFAIFATLLERVLLYMWLGFFAAWGVHFFARVYFFRKTKES